MLLFNFKLKFTTSKKINAVCNIERQFSLPTSVINKIWSLIKPKFASFIPICYQDFLRMGEGDSFCLYKGKYSLNYVYLFMHSVIAKDNPKSHTKKEPLINLINKLNAINISF